MKGVGIVLAAGLLALAATGARAQTISYAQAGGLLAQSCGPDILKFCPDVNLGGGKLHACLEAHDAQVSPQCKTDYVAVRASIGKRVAAQHAIFKLCNADVARLCPGMVEGDGNLLSCLLEATKVVSPPCNQAITDAGFR